MGTQEDDGWVNAEDYDGYIPFESKEENEKRLAALHERQAAAADANDELPFGNFDDGSGSRQTYSNDDIKDNDAKKIKIINDGGFNY